jgi:hypothetical protein
MSGLSFSPTPVFYVFIGLLIGLIIGWAIGFFDSNSRTAKKIQSAELKAEAATKEAKAKLAQAEQQIAAASLPSQKAEDDPGLLRLKKNNNLITVEMDGALIADALSPDRKKRLIELISVFRPYLEGVQPSPASVQPIAPIQASNPPVPASVQRDAAQPIQPSVPITKKPEPEKSITALSIVGQIDTVLQKRLMTTPLAKSGIRLQESLQGGVEVYVGLQKYSSIDDVPDETIKVAIRAAIAEWEQVYTPGM